MMNFKDGFDHILSVEFNQFSQMEVNLYES